MEFRNLRADEIEARIAMVSEKGCQILLYKNARCDMNILDQAVGPLNWQRDHKELKGNMYAGISIFDPEKGMWVTKWDCGTESFTEAEKGEASDSFKRAGFNWGIGRELYTAPFIWFKATQLKNHSQDERSGKWRCTDSFGVEAVEYTGNKISYLKIVDNKSKEVYTWGRSRELQPENVNDRITEEEYAMLNQLLSDADVNIEKLLQQYHVNSLMLLTKVQYTALVNKLSKVIAEKG